MTYTVLHVLVPEPPGEVGGADLHLLDLAVSQQTAGMRPVILERGSAEFAERARAAGIDVVSATGQRFSAAVAALGECLDRVGPDIVHAHGYDADYWATAARLRWRSRFGGRALVFTQHGVIEDTLWHKGKTLLDAACTRLADGVICCGAHLVPRMRAWCASGVVEYVPNGVRAPAGPPRRSARAELAQRFGVPDDAAIVAYVGRLSAEKRVDLALAAVGRARDAGQPVHLVVTGSGSERPSLERQAREMGLTDSVTFVGLLWDPSVVLAAADALLLLSDTEGTPRVVIEAMMCGVPVVASAVGGVPHLLADGAAGWLAPPDDPAAAARALLAALADGETRAAAGRRRAHEEFGIDVMQRRVAAFYERALGSRRAPHAVAASD